MDLKEKDINYEQHRMSIEIVDIDNCNAEVLIPKFPIYKHGEARTLHDINYNFDSQQINNNGKIKFAKNLKRIQINYDNLEQKKKFTDNVKISKESQMIISNEHSSYDRRSQYEKDK